MQLANRRFRMMGTVIDVTCYLPEPDKEETIFQTVQAKLADYEYRFSANSSTSQIAAINAAAGRQPVQVDQDLFDLIALGKFHSCQPNTYLNIAIGPLIQLWRVGFSNARLPEPAEIDDCLKRIDPQQIILNPKDHSVFLAVEGMKLDLGAVAKGYFADQILAYLRTQGIESAFINLGGNLLTMGEAYHQPDGLWRIGIQDPQKTRGTDIALLLVRDKSVVTSGIYERTFTTKGKTYHHIFSPRTGYPIESDLASLTILSDLSVTGEIWTTHLFGKDIPQIMGELAIQPGIEGILIDKENTIYQALTDHRPILQNSSIY